MGNCGQDIKTNKINKNYKRNFQENYMGFCSPFVVNTIMKLSVKIIKLIIETISNRKPWRSWRSENLRRRNCVTVEAFSSALISMFQLCGWLNQKYMLLEWPWSLLFYTKTQVIIIVNIWFTK